MKTKSHPIQINPLPHTDSLDEGDREKHMDWAIRRRKYTLVKREGCGKWYRE